MVKVVVMVTGGGTSTSVVHGVELAGGGDGGVVVSVSHGVETGGGGGTGVDVSHGVEVG